MPCEVRLNRFNGFCGLIDIGEGEQTFAGWDALAVAGIFCDHRAAAREVGEAAIAEPSGFQDAMQGLRAHELAERVPDVFGVFLGRGDDLVRVADSPTSLLEGSSITGGV